MDSETVALAGLIVGTVAAVAAAVFAGLARKDLGRVEKNTAEMSARVGRLEAQIKSIDGRLREQHAREMIESAARRVSICVRGDQGHGQPLQMIFTVTSPGSDATLASIDMLNEAGSLSGSASCTRTAPRTFTASLDDSVARQWYGAGAVANACSRRVVIRAHLLIDERKAKREFAAYLWNQLKDTELGFQDHSLMLMGDC